MAKGATGSFALKLGNTGMAFVTSVLLARWLGASTYGEYIYAISWMTLISVAARMGFDIITSRFLSAYIYKNEWGLVNGYLRFSIIAIIVSSLICMLVADVIAWNVPEDSMPISYDIFWVALLLLPITTLNAPFRGYLVSLHKVFWAQLPSFFINPAIFLILIISIYMFSPDFLSVINIFILQIVAASIGLGFVVYFAKNEFSPEIRNAKPKYQARKWFSAALPVSLMGGMTVVNMNADILMLGSMSGAESAAIYKAATRGAELMLLASTMIHVSLSPVISRLYTTGDMVRLQRGLTKTVRITFALSLPVLLGLIVFGQWFLLLFGDEFVYGYNALVMLCAGQFVTVILGSSEKVLVMTGREKKATFTLIASTIINLLLNYLLIPPMGILGAAIATTSSLVFMNIVLAYHVKKSLELNSTVFAMMSCIK